MSRFKEGDIVKIIDEPSTGMWQDCVGRFPVNLITRVTEVGAVVTEDGRSYDFLALVGLDGKRYAFAADAIVKNIEKPDKHKRFQYHMNGPYIDEL